MKVISKPINPDAYHFEIIYIYIYIYIYKFEFGKDDV